MEKVLWFLGVAFLVWAVIAGGNAIRESRENRSPMTQEEMDDYDSSDSVESWIP